MFKKILSVFLVCVSLMTCVSVLAGARVSVADVKNFRQASATSSSVTLEWDEVKKAVGYRIYKYDSKSGKYKSNGFFSECTATLKGLTASKSYKLRIKAYTKENGKKIYSKNYTRLNVYTSPAKPSGVKVSQKKQTSFLLSWNKTSHATGYRIERFNIETDKWYKYKTTTDTSLKIKREGKYRVLAYRTRGERNYYSSPSASVSGKFKYVPSESGTFTFTVYGYGHGVGMSQTGAQYYAEKGYSYKKILTHYYKGTKILKDENAPEKVTYGEKKYSLSQYLYRVTQAEIGNAAPAETIKAQVVACYSYAKYYSFKLHTYDHAFSSKNAVSNEVKAAVDAVIGEYVSYDGKVCLTPYFAIAAGKTASCESTWGGKLPYLTAANSSCDKNNKYWKSTYTISSEDFKKRFSEDYEEELTGDPVNWIKIVSHDKAVSSGIGYVDFVTVGTKTFRGEKFRSSVMHYALRSHCFTVSYKAD